MNSTTELVVQKVYSFFERVCNLGAPHDRAHKAGQSVTKVAHLRTEKVAAMALAHENCRDQAAAISTFTLAVVARLLDHRPEDRLRQLTWSLGRGHT